jgi:hypothetical protein
VRKISLIGAGFAVGAALLSGTAVTQAGLFSRKNPECCDPQPEPPKEKRPCCWKPELPPRGATASAIPAVITPQRADRAPAPAAPAAAPVTPRVAPVPAACTDGAPAAAAADAQLRQDVEQLKQQIRALTILLNKPE